MSENNQKQLPCSDYAELTPDEQSNVVAYWDSVALSHEAFDAPASSVVPKEWIAEYYCWDDVHEGGWGCEQCYKEYRENLEVK